MVFTRDVVVTKHCHEELLLCWEVNIFWSSKLAKVNSATCVDCFRKVSKSRNGMSCYNTKTAISDVSSDEVGDEDLDITFFDTEISNVEVLLVVHMELNGQVVQDEDSANVTSVDWAQVTFAVWAETSVTGSVIFTGKCFPVSISDPAS